MFWRFVLMTVVLAAAVQARGSQTDKKQSALDSFIAEALAGGEAHAARTPGSLWSAGSPYALIGADLRARRLHDAITIVVVDRASAIAKGTTKSARSSQASASIGAIAGTPPGGNRLPALLDLGSKHSLEGEGETSRETLLRTTLSARVTHVLPNGDMVVRGVKTVRINSEAQAIEVRGIVRQVDISPSNTVLSDQLSFLEVAVDGKGVVNDAIRRPNFLYRILLGILPF
jgi:flagellar L-ring protein precursor FlgH